MAGFLFVVGWVGVALVHTMIELRLKSEQRNWLEKTNS